MKNLLAQTVFLLTVAILLPAFAAAQSKIVPGNAPPQILKIEPPNWWANHTINPVRILVRGENLASVSKIESKDKSLKISNLKTNGRGDYLFFDLEIAGSAKIGKYNFVVSSANGSASIPFEINAPLDAGNNFQGITGSDVVYLIMTDRFADGDRANDKDADRLNPRAWHGGDFRGITQKLSYLKELGVTAIWLTPWYDNPDEANQCDKPWCPNTNYHGYHAIDYYAVENHFGTFADLRELVEAAHRNGIKVIQDQVANHVGVQHPWAKKPPLENWFNQFAQNSFNNSVLLSPNSSKQERDNLLKGWFNELLPDLNQEEPEAAKYEIQNALWWIGMTGIDGIRQDTIQYMPRKFIRDWSTAILKQYPKFYMVGEVFERDSAQTAFFQGGRAGWDGIDTDLPGVFDFKLWDTSCEVFTGKKPVRALRDVLKYDALYPDVNKITVLQNNHDTKRFMSLDGATLTGAMLHTAFVLSARGIPQLYYGEELAMKGGDDPFNRADFAGGWTEDKVNKFTKTGRTEDERKMFEEVKAWIEIRKKFDALKFGKTIDLRYDENTYVFVRQSDKETIVIGLNRANKSDHIKFDAGAIGFSAKNIVCRPNGGNAALQISNQGGTDGTITLALPPQSAIAYECFEARN